MQITSVKNYSYAFFGVKTQNNTKKTCVSKAEYNENRPENTNFQTSSLKAHVLNLSADSKTVTSIGLANKINSQMGILENKDIQIMFNNISAILKKNDIKAKKEDILYAMFAMTQWANMDSLKEGIEKLGKIYNLEQETGSNIENTTASYLMSDNLISIDRVFKYLIDKKRVLPNIFAPNIHKMVEKHICSIDKISLKKLEQSIKEKKCMIGNRFKSGFTFYYLVGWDNGINFFNQTDNYTDFENKCAKMIRNSYNMNIDFETALNKVLIKDTLKRASSLGIEEKDIHFITRNKDKNEITLDDIKNNLNSKEITPKTIDAVVKGIVMVSGKKIKNYAESELIKYFDKGIKVYSPKTLSIKLKEIYSKIEESLPDGYCMDNVYYLIPDVNKSYCYINRQFAEVNKIGVDKFIYGDIAKVENKYKNRIFVCLDDIIASGKSALCQSDGFNYEKNERNNTYYIASVYCSSFAENKINKEINKNNSLKGKKEPKDKLIIADTEDDNINKKNNPVVENILKKYQEITSGSHGYDHIESKVAFPHMTPDTNPIIMKYLFEKLIEGSSIKGNINDREIDQETKKQIKRILENK